MGDVNDDAKIEFRRIELLTGLARRRRWSAETKARTVAETLEPEAGVSDVARAWQVDRQQALRLAPRGWILRRRRRLRVTLLV